MNSAANTEVTEPPLQGNHYLPDLDRPSTKHPTLVRALIAAQRNVKAVAKKAKNAHHGYNYASADAIIDEASEALAAEGLGVLPVWIGRDPDQPDHVWTGVGDDAWIITPRRIKAIYKLIHESGQEHLFESSTPVIPEKGRPEDKAEFGARTENLGYALRDVLLIPREDQAAQTPSARDDRSYQQRGPATKAPAPSAAPPKGNGAQPGPKAQAGAAPTATSQGTSAGGATQPTTPTPATMKPSDTTAAQTAGGDPAPANETSVVRELTAEQRTDIGRLFRSLVPKVSAPEMNRIAKEVTGKLADDMSFEDGEALKKHLGERIAKQAVAS